MPDQHNRNRPSKSRLLDSWRCNIGFMSWAVRGVLRPNPFFIKLFYKYNVDRWRTGRIYKMRKRYGRAVSFKLLRPRKKCILIMEPALAQSILHQSVDLVGESSIRTERSDLWIRGAQTGIDGSTHTRISTFADHVLGNHFGKPGAKDSHLGAYLNIVEQAVDGLKYKRHLGAVDFDFIGEEIASQIILGQASADHQAYRNLDVLLKSATNIIKFKAKEKERDALEAHLAELLQQKLNNHSLVSLLQSTSIKSDKVDDCLSSDECLAQIKMWMFSMRDGLQLQPARVLTLILTHPHVYQKVKKEIDAADLSNAEDIRKLETLTSCVGETLRLWPTVEYFIREFKDDAIVDGMSFERGDTVFMPISYLQRDVEIYGTRTNVFEPELWLQDYNETLKEYAEQGTKQCPFHNNNKRPFASFSLGPKACPGRDLVTVLIVATVARLLKDHYMRPLAPENAPNSFIRPAVISANLAFERAPITANNDSDDYEFIVVGSGAGGGPTACNLARAGHRVLLLEAGDDHSKNIKSRVPAFHAASVDDPDMSWPFAVKHFSDSFLNANDRKAEGDRIVYPRASTLGGCTTHNALVTILPPDSDWQKIAEVTGDAGWLPERMRRHYEEISEFRRSKGIYGFIVSFITTMPFSKTRRFGEMPWLTLEQANPRLAVGSRTLILSIYYVLLQIYFRRLLSLDGFKNSFLKLIGSRHPNSKRWTANNYDGLTSIPLSRRSGERIGPREYVLQTLVDCPDKLTVKTNSLVTRLIFNNTKDKVIGVKVREGKQLYQHKLSKAYVENTSPNSRVSEKEYLTSKEVILAAGTFNTPQILMLSGIGDKKHLEQHNIDVVSDQPQVGQSLRDRLEISVVMKLIRDISIVADATNIGAGVREKLDTTDPHYRNWENGRRGAYTTSGLFIGVTRQSKHAIDPDLFLFATPGFFEGYRLESSKNLSGNAAVDCTGPEYGVGRYLTWSILKKDPASVFGHVKLTSSDPTEPPDINFKYFNDGDTESDTAEKDIDALMEGVQFVRDMIRIKRLKNVLRSELIPGWDKYTGSLTNGDKLRDYVKLNSWGHHAAGSCRMGSDQDDYVCNGQGEVKCVSGLRIVDASIFPVMPGFFIALPIMLAAQKISQDILHKYGSVSERNSRRAATVLAIQSATASSSPGIKQKLRRKAENYAHYLSNKKQWHQPMFFPRSIFQLWALRERANRENLDDALTGRDFSLEDNSTALAFGTNKLEMGNPGYVFGRNVQFEHIKPEPPASMLSDPDPRTVADTLFKRSEFKPAHSLNALAAAWIQFQNHEWFRHSLDVEWEQSLGIKKTRKMGAVAVKDGDKGRQIPVFANEFSSWWDGSQVYGESPESQAALRENHGSKLKVVPTPLTDHIHPKLEGNKILLLPELVENGVAKGVDHTGNSNGMWVGLSLLHNLFTLEHNAICEQLEKNEPSIRGDANRIYRTARLINSALMIKIHSIEWSVGLLNNPAIRVALNANWQGLFRSLHLRNNIDSFPVSTRIPNHHGGSDVLKGILGSTVEHYRFPYSLTEEFVAVYRMHSLLPDNFKMFDISQTNPEVIGDVDFDSAQAQNTRRSILKYGPENWYYTLGKANAGSMSLNNYPNALRRFSDPDHDGKEIDLAVIDIFRDRERAVPRYNQFREELGLPRFKSMDEFVDQIPEDDETRKHLRAAFKEVYQDQIDKVDLVVGLHAEAKPQGFAISDTAFRIFLHMASRRIKSDVFLTEYLDETTYTATGLNWIAENNFRRVLLRHYGKLEPYIRLGDNPFAPWKD